MTIQEASTATVTRLCFERFQQCLQQLDGKEKIHIQTRLADLRLWADNVGAVANAKALLDLRFADRAQDISLIRKLLLLLGSFLRELRDSSVTAGHKADLQDIINNIDSTIDTLAFIGVQIRGSGRKSRMRKADDSFDQNRDRYQTLRAHFVCVVSSRPTIGGKPTVSKQHVHSLKYFAELNLTPIQERLVEANLRRRHRFQEAQ